MLQRPKAGGAVVWDMAGTARGLRGSPSGKLLGETGISMKFRPLKDLPGGLRHYTPNNDKRRRSPGFFLENLQRRFRRHIFGGKPGIFFSARKKSQRKSFEYAHGIDRVFHGAVICCLFGRRAESIGGEARDTI